MPFASLAEIFIFLVILGGIYFLLKPLQQKVERFIKKYFVRRSTESEIIDVTPKPKKESSKKP